MRIFLIKFIYVRSFHEPFIIISPSIVDQVSVIINHQSYTTSAEFAKARPISGNVHERLKLNFSPRELLNCPYTRIYLLIKSYQLLLQ